MAEMSYGETLRVTTEKYLDEIDDKDMTPQEIEVGLLESLYSQISLHNSFAAKDERWPILINLSPVQIAQVMARRHSIYRLATSEASVSADYDILAIYQNSGDNKGIYVSSQDAFRSVARSYNYTLSTKGFQEVMSALRDFVPRKLRCSDPDLIAVNNGIFDYKAKKLLPFTDELIFVSKSHVNYNPNATNVVIHNDNDNTDWDIETWMSELSDDPEVVDLLWQILGAIIRPNVRWDKSAWMYSEQGNNGKGTLCELMRQLCGAGSYASIPLNLFSQDFMLEPLTHTSAIIVDENDVGTYVDKAANLKAVITGDVININRKHKDPIAYQFSGFMVQCLNEFPRIKDRSNSFYRRQLFIPMDKCFTGIERKYIKSDYLHRQDVLEYVLKRVLHMNYYELKEPEACMHVLDEYKQFNNPIRQFWFEMESELVWDFVPNQFLFDLYMSWFTKNIPGGTPVQKRAFIKEIRTFISETPRWFDNTDKKKRISNLMDKPEPLIEQYSLKDWINNTKPKFDTKGRCTVDIATCEHTKSGFARGIVRNLAYQDPVEEDDIIDIEPIEN